jgi:hypothetical protein
LSRLTHLSGFGNLGYFWEGDEALGDEQDLWEIANDAPDDDESKDIKAVSDEAVNPLFLKICVSQGCYECSHLLEGDQG